MGRNVHSRGQTSSEWVKRPGGEMSRGAKRPGGVKGAKRQLATFAPCCIHWWERKFQGANVPHRNFRSHYRKVSPASQKFGD